MTTCAVKAIKDTVPGTGHFLLKKHLNSDLLPSEISFSVEEIGVYVTFHGYSLTKKTLWFPMQNKTQIIILQLSVHLTRLYEQDKATFFTMLGTEAALQTQRKVNLLCYNETFSTELCQCGDMR